mmetsp:Transcript_7400/g.7263  ORF Transcript_7400/g.7263 Transcript_7400/m.7263 type:complete len:210 (+) Transcript_7400:420-1049(+)
MCTPPSTTLRSRNGLKALSWRVKEIVERFGSATYKDVADELLRELQSNQGDEDFKDEKNVRRRVYDALNVLIAAEILQKRGKMVESRNKSSYRLCFKSENSETFISKRKKLKQLLQHYVAIKNLIERNKNLQCASDRLKLPFTLVTVSSESNEEVSIKTNIQRSKIHIKFESPITVMEPVEVLKELGLHSNPAGIHLEALELCNYASPS